jgi:hypothetical protein
MNPHTPDEKVRHEQTEHYPETQSDYAEEEISLKPIIRILWSYRKRMEIAFGAVVAVLIIVVLCGFLFVPNEKVASITFRLVFEGVDKGKYPNGTAFSTAEIIATPVLSEVYANNKLATYFSSFEDFKNSIFMMEANPDVQLLDYEYQTKLSDTKMTPVERARIEAEYKKKRESLSAPIYSLNFRRQGHAAAVPTVLLDKVMQDILATWAKQADQRKGALKYNIPVYSQNILQKDFIESEDYVIGIDILRAKIVRILSSVDQILTLPGASVVRIGPERISLREVRANLEDIARFKLQPLVGMIRASGLSKNPKLLVTYLENQLFQIKLDRDEEHKKIQVLQDGLRTYMSERGGIPVKGAQGAESASSASRMAPLDTPALIPQFGESFLDRIVTFSQQNSDVKYRQELVDKILAEGIPSATLEKEAAYYEDLIKSVKGFEGNRAHSTNEAAAEQAVKGTVAAIDEVVKALNQIGSIYQELCTQNLNPQTVLYSITSPFISRTERLFTLRTAALYGALTLFLALILVPIGCLIHNYFRTEFKN